MHLSRVRKTMGGEVKQIHSVTMWTQLVSTGRSISRFPRNGHSTTCSSLSFGALLSCKCIKSITNEYSSGRTQNLPCQDICVVAFPPTVPEIAHDKMVQQGPSSIFWRATLWVNVKLGLSGVYRAREPTSKSLSTQYSWGSFCQQQCLKHVSNKRRSLGRIKAQIQQGISHLNGIAKADQKWDPKPFWTFWLFFSPYFSSFVYVSVMSSCVVL